MDEHEQCKQEAAEAASRIAGLEAQVARLREALEFYGREWESDFVVAYATEDLLEDGGAKARAALSSTAPAWVPTHRHHSTDVLVRAVSRAILTGLDDGQEIVIVETRDGQSLGYRVGTFNAMFAPLPAAAAQEP